MATRPTEGEPAPSFSLQTQSGATVSLSDYAGKTVVLYFYPADDTPGCTTESCALRDLSAEYTVAGAVILGISPDDVASHTAFAGESQESRLRKRQRPNKVVHFLCHSPIGAERGYNTGVVVRRKVRVH